MVLSKPLFSILFGRGAFNSEAIEMTSKVLFYYSIGMIGYWIYVNILDKILGFYDKITAILDNPNINAFKLSPEGEELKANYVNSPS
ncbi:MviN-like protein [Alkalithermobacter thermoalcaliphilus JW-YL-7 = DSM 7308]|uniref:MviN-like protein n=1 Tax=Alkalithermobacter thermoalcaliphilus JW-YL-7 = DSM 7308 TaxID=1121328 RepID=A0A150FU59_CLOPD|nr:virulence factor MVIN family protein [[Clostridium] paradoxum JW-YL-7 = DSM 7308]SHK70309.1 MviN-like protein [[Clostridium] paradoxum JW-YL-7 = DSM 7308]